MTSVNLNHTTQSDLLQPKIGDVSDLEINIVADVCPMTFVRTRLGLDQLSKGQILAVRLRGEEPRRNVPVTVAELGHDVLGMIDEADGVTRLLIRKG